MSNHASTLLKPQTHYRYEHLKTRIHLYASPRGDIPELLENDSGVISSDRKSVV